jgi:hypothetical protein
MAKLENQKVRLFSNCSEADRFEQRNCERCQKVDLYDAKSNCVLYDAMLFAYWNDGDVNREIADRLGYSQNNQWDCKERILR